MAMPKNSTNKHADRVQKSHEKKAASDNGRLVHHNRKFNSENVERNCEIQTPLFYDNAKLKPNKLQ